MKTGEAAREAVQHEEAKAELAKEAANRMFDFWLPEDEERIVTFLDGTLDSDGMLDILMYYQHQIQVGGKWQTFICTQDSEGVCCLCDRGDSNRSLIGAFTVIDHTPHTIQKGPNSGKIIANTRKLFKAKKGSLALLTKLAQKKGGGTLVGVTVEITRTGDKSPSVGSAFDFQEKLDGAELAEKYGLKEEDIQPADYEKELGYRTNDELVELGLGTAPKGPGYETPKQKAALKENL